MIWTAATAFTFALLSATNPAAGSGLSASANATAGMQAATASMQAGAAQGNFSGKEILTRKCFQCHQASMWTSVRGDRKEWLGVLYRMVGRGALWTEEEITAMADFLAQTRAAEAKAQSPNR